MDIKHQLLLMAQYNVWATSTLCNSLSVVTDEDFHKNMGLFFQSVSGTLNHLLLGEHYLWYPRFKVGKSPSLALDSVIHQDKTELLAELRDKSKHWIAFVEDLDPILLDGMLHYNRANGEALSLPFTGTLLHVFNHATHHRGQVTAALTGMGYPCPELDLVYMLLEQQQ